LVQEDLFNEFVKKYKTQSRA